MFFEDWTFHFANMEEKKIYPFSLEPIEGNSSWGEQSWKVADLGSRDSVIHSGMLKDNTLSEIMETYLDRIVGDEAYYFYGRQFPVMVKTFSTENITPLWVCPDDEIASQRYDALGKAKLWYVADAEEDSCLYLGFRRDLSAGDFYEGCLDSSVFSELNEVPVKAGDAFVIAPGVVHCAGKGLKIVEVAESSDLDFVLSTRSGKGDHVFLEEAFDFVNLKAGIPPLSDRTKLAELGQFVATRVDLSSALRIDNAEDSGYTVYYCLGGSVSIQTPVAQDAGKRMDNLTIDTGEAAIVPADVEEFFLVPTSSSATLIEVMGGKSSAVDSYTGEKIDTEKTL